MFCDGMCSKGKKRCGLFWTITYTNENGEIKTEDRCGIIELQLTLGKINTQQVSTQASIESFRNLASTNHTSLFDMIISGFKMLALLLSKKDGIDVKSIEL